MRFLPRKPGVMREHRGDTGGPQRSGENQTARRKPRSFPAAQQPVLGTTLRMHDMFAVKHHAQAMPQGKLFQTEECGTAREAADGHRLPSPGRTEVPEPKLRHIPVRQGPNQSALRRQSCAQAARLIMASIDHDAVQGRNGCGWRCHLRCCTGNGRKRRDGRSLKEFAPIDHCVPLGEQSSIAPTAAGIPTTSESTAAAARSPDQCPGGAGPRAPHPDVLRRHWRDR